MKKFVLDTCILVHFLTKNSVSEQIEADLQITASDCIPIISSVTKGELLSFAKQRNWGANKQEMLNMLLNNTIIVDIAAKDKDLMDTYAFIDAFSKRKIANEVGELMQNSAIQMGKNDLWIAATAKVLQVPLVTTDKDFIHLKDSVIDVRYYPIESKLNKQI